MQHTESFILKIIQLYDTIQVRHGLMIVGPTGGGKTSNYKVLSQALSDLKDEPNPSFEQVHCHVLNPKSITMGQLYGFTDMQTQEWQNGILEKIINDCSKDDSPDKHWIMCDGPVDALWIESMNTVLDDNKKLCLNSGQIIALTPRMVMMFEVEDLAVASPATVSRCGMVYMEPESLTLVPLVESWLNTLPPKVKANEGIVSKLTDLYSDLLEPACYFMRKNCPEIVKTVNNNVAQSSMRILDCYMKEYIENEVKRVSNDKVDELYGMIKELFFFSIIWSIGTTTTT